MTKGPGKSHRKGITLMELAELFPTEESAREWFEGIHWRAPLPALRQPEHLRVQACEDALPLPRLREVLQREDGHAHGRVAPIAQDVALRDLSRLLAEAHKHGIQ